jgi:uncharacterized hydrophobic protein (TIGR00271 family)
MRQLLVQVPSGNGRDVMSIAREFSGTSLACFTAEGPDDALDLVLVHVSNHQVEPMLARLQELPNLHVTFMPSGVITLKPPPEEAPEQVTEVALRSPIEVFLSGLQSIGSWMGFLGYAATAGVVVWVGLFTNTVFLLVAAMLIAPFAGPAMNMAIATARGDWILFRQSFIRYFASISLTIAICTVLSLVLQQEIATELMVQVSEISVIAILIPLAAGVAGGFNLVQSERNSLVSAAGVGILVAASLAPPAGLIGMAAAIGRWDMIPNGVFLILLQLLGINLAGAVVFHLFGLTSQGPRYNRGRQWLSVTILGLTLLAIAGMLVWQFCDSPDKQRSSQAQRAAAHMQQVIYESGLALPVEINARFTRTELPHRNTLLGVAYVQRRVGVTLGSEDIRNRITRDIQERLIGAGFQITPLVDVIVLEPH